MWPHYIESTKTLESYQQSSLCDCYRPPKFNPKLTYENRFIKRSTRYGETNLIYLQNFKNNIRMNRAFPPYAPYSSASQSCIPGQSRDRINAFEGDLKAIMWKVLPMLNATHAFINFDLCRLYRIPTQLFLEVGFFSNWSSIVPLTSYVRYHAVKEQAASHLSHANDRYKIATPPSPWRTPPQP